jgi:DNA-binding beta-propeller fold protein YncE
VPGLENTANIAVFTVRPGGAVTALGTPITTGTAPRGIALSPRGDVAYVVNSIARTVSPYPGEPVSRRAA